MSRMFQTGDGRVMKTWNVFSGCLFRCSYCFARRLAEGRLKHVERYRDGFIPHFNSGELFRHFSPRDWVFISDMGDISFATPNMVKLILARVWSMPDVTFLSLSKNPARFREWLEWGQELPPNLYIGTTLETNRPHRFSKAPPPADRVRGLRGLWGNTFVSLEPLMDFDLEPFVQMLQSLKPRIIEVGADNHRNYLPEPLAAKVKELLERLRLFCPHVIEKGGLSRLTGISQEMEGVA